MTQLVLPIPIVYPDSDGEPMSDNMRQYQWITTIHAGLAAQFERENVLVAGNLLWYPVEGHPEIRIGPDILVAFGRPKDLRGSYRQWEEEGVAPHVVFEIMSPGNRAGEMRDKLAFYEKYGVEEYYVYDPDRDTLKGYTRIDDELCEVSEMNGWTSPRLKIRFELLDGEFEVFGSNGRRFDTAWDSIVQRDAAEKRAAKSEAARIKAEAARIKAEAEKKEISQRAEAEKKKITEKAEAEKQEIAEKAKTKMNLMRQRMLDHGLDPDGGSDS